MNVRIQCPHCNKVISVSTEHAGKKGKCPGCGQIFMIPNSLAPSPPPSDFDNVYNAEDASGGLPPLSDPNSSMFGDSGFGGGASQDNLGYGLSNDLLSELDRQPGIPVSSTSEPVRMPCPVCREPIVRGAAKCHHCGEIFDLVLKEHEKYKQKKRSRGGVDDDLTIGEILVGIFCGCPACIISIVWMIQGKKKGFKMLGVIILSTIVWTILRLIIEAARQGAIQ